MPSLLQWLAAHPYLLLFAIVLAAVPLGRLAVGGYSLGTTAAALVVGVCVAWTAAAHGVRLVIDPGTRTIFVSFFVYALALRVGPSLIPAFRGEHLRFGLLALVSTAVALVAALAIVHVWELPAAAVGGILSGAATATIALATAEEVERASGLAALGYAVNYVWATLGVLLVCRYLPRWWGIDVHAETRECEERLGVPHFDDAGLTGYRPLVVRAYRVVNDTFVGWTVGQFQQKHPQHKVLNVLRLAPARAGVDEDEAPARLAVERESMALAADGVQSVTSLRESGPPGYPRRHRPRPADSHYARMGSPDDLRLHAGDIVVVGGNGAELLSVGPEVADPTALNVPLDQAEIHVTRDEAIGMELGDLRSADFAGQIALHHIERGGVPVPLALRTRLQRYDVLFVSGVKGGVDKLAALAGRMTRPGACADLLVLALGMVLGLALGTVSLPLARGSVELGPAGGLLLAGLLISAAAPSLRLASFAPCAARGLLEEFGLVMFVATVALQAGALLDAQGSTELVAKLFVAGFVTGTLPLLVAWTLGLHVMKISPAILVGAVAGARAHTAPAREAARVTGSSVPWIGFPHAYAAATALLGAAGFIAMLVAR